MKLPKIYTYFDPGEFFTIHEVQQKLGTSGNTLRKRLSELSLKGYLCPVRKGLYYLTKADKKIETNIKSPYVVASKLTPECHIGFKTALQFHANKIPPEQDTVYVVSPSKFNSFQFENRFFFWCQNSCKNGIEKYTLSHHGLEFEIRATNFEKSLVDCLKRPSICPSFFELIRLCEETNKVPDVEKILKYVTECNVQIMFNRVGVLFEKIKNKWDLDEHFFQELERKMNKRQTYWPILFHPRSNQETSLYQQKSNIREHFTLGTIKRRWKIYFSE